MTFFCCSPATHLRKKPSSISLNPCLQALVEVAIGFPWTFPFSRLNKPHSPASPPRASAHHRGCHLLDVSQAIDFCLVLGGLKLHAASRCNPMSEKGFSRVKPIVVTGRKKKESKKIVIDIKHLTLIRHSGGTCLSKIGLEKHPTTGLLCYLTN